MIHLLRVQLAPQAATAEKAAPVVTAQMLLPEA
jgi:hypothetical protein